MFIQYFTNSRYDENVLMGHVGELSGQDFDLFVIGYVFVHDEHVLDFHCAQAAFNLYAGCPQIQFGNGHRQFFGQIL
jgi:hypothetical protein